MTDDDDGIGSMIALLNDTSSDRAAWLDSLTRLQKDVLPRVPAAAARQLLVQADDREIDIDIDTGSSTGGLGRTLLGIVGNGSVAEICREKAILVLKGLLLESSSTAAAGQLQVWSTKWIVQFYVDYCDMVCRRITVASDTDKSERESSESIRLELLLAVSALLDLLPNDDTNDPEDDNDATILNAATMEEASSKLCRAMAGGSCPVLVEAYPEIHRQSCRILMQFAGMRWGPHLLAGHAPALLPKLVGGTDQSPGLMSHRHAKTRCVALDAIAAILCCCCDHGESSSDDIGCIGCTTLLESAHVLSRWEEGPVFDRSAQVRTSVQRSVGKVSRKLTLSFFDGSSHIGDGNQEGTSEATVTASSTSTGCRLLSLFLMGLSDDIECVRQSASEEMHSSLGGGNELAELLSKHAHFMLVDCFLRDATRLSGTADDKRTRKLNAATRLLQLMAESNDMNTAFTRSGSSNDRAAAAAAAAAAETASDISFALCACLNEDDAGLSEAASHCALVLGADDFSAALLIDTVLDSLLRRDESAMAHIGGISSTLALLESLLRGQCTALQQESSKGEGYADGSQLRLLDISAALRSEVVLDAIFSEGMGMTSSVLGICDAFVDVVGATMDSVGGSEPRKSSPVPLDAVISNVLTTAMYLLAAGNRMDLDAIHLHTAIDALLEKVAAICGSDNGGSDLINAHYFRKVLVALQGEGGETQYLPRSLGAFDALVRSSDGSVVAENYDLVGPIFEAACISLDDKEDNLTTKLSMMALLESVVSNESFAECIDQSNVSNMADKVILPNLIWRSGGRYSALRKVSLGALFSLLSGGSVKSPTLTALLAPQLSPVLRSTLSDDDPSTKELACYCIASMFGTIDFSGINVGKKEVSALCLEMSRCLEDESNNVRVAACGALGTFLSIISSEREDCVEIVVSEIIQQLHIHSNDPSLRVRSAASKALEATK